MPVATFTQPNYTSDTGTGYPTNIDAAINVVAELGRDFAPNAAATPNLTVKIAAGKIIKADGTLISQAEQTATFVAPVTNPRIDRVVVDMLTGVYSIVAGTEAASPAAPAITAGKLPCAQVSLTVGITQITNALLTDERTAYCQYKANPAQMESGALASGVTIPASQITAGTMGAGTVPLARLDGNTGSVTWNPGVIAAGAQSGQNISVTGAAIGDFVLVSKDSSFLAGLTLEANVLSSGNVTLTLCNMSTGSIDPPSLTYNVKVIKKDF